MILIINWALIAYFTFVLVAAIVQLVRGKARPLVQIFSCTLCMLVLALAVTMWNSEIPVWIWWAMSLLYGAAVGLAAWRVAGGQRSPASDSSIPATAAA
jgi:uncharacterized membrane protein YvlD (DUF360 family)